MTPQQLKDEFELLTGPGHTILDCIDQKNLTLAEFAAKIHMTVDDLIMLIMGNIPIDQKIAQSLAENTIIDNPEFWLNSEALYRNKLNALIKNVANEP